MPTHFPDFPSFAAWLTAKGLFHMDLALGRMHAALDRLGLARPPFPTLHVVGTNGKGSTSAFLAALARASGFTAGLYTSPHFLSLRERATVNGEPLPEAAWLSAANRLLPLAEELGLTYFEVLTVLSLMLFAGAGVTLAVMEAGLGGRYDAVSVLPHAALCVTPIGLDHTAQLGPTVADIARDKAGAMRPGEPVFSAPQTPEVLAVLTREAAATRADFHGPEALLPLPEGLTLAMAGSHQKDNARLALTTWRAMAPRLGVTPDPAAEAAALAAVQVPGRFQRIPGSPEFILDGAHNAHGLAALARTLAELDLRPAAVIFSCFKDKDVAAMAPLVAALTSGPVFIPPIAGFDRAADPAALAAALSAAIGPRAVPVADLASALSRAAAAGSPVLVCGSLYLLAEFYTTEQAVEKPPSASLLRKVQTLA
jgi:dihydrofolate synthase/folylpolyglutamate synthase